MIRMTDMENILLQKKPDLKSYYNLAQEAYQENDVEEALKISKNGLKQAKLQNSGEWIDRFDSLNTNISQGQTDTMNSAQESSLLSSIKKEAITIVKGIGSKLAEKLYGIGIHTVAELARSPSERIARVNGIGLATAQKYVSSAKEHMKMKKLNDFPEANKSEENLENRGESNLRVEPNKWFEKKFEKPETEKLYPPAEVSPVAEPLKIDSENYESSINNFEELDYEEIDEDGSSIINYDDTDRKIELNEPLLVEESEKNNTLVVSPELLRQSNLTLQERNTASQEVLPHAQVKESLMRITKDLKLSGFGIIEKLPKLRVVFTGIDLLAIKHVRVKEFLDLIYILPIKICTLKGSLIISSESVQYNSTKKIEDTSFRVDRLPQSYLKALSQVKLSIYSDIVSEGVLLRYLSRYLGTNISLEKSFTRKNLFFRSGPLQHKILIEPVLVCQNIVGFTEKIIPFAYQKNSNIHIVQHSKFADLLQYLDQKYFLIETYSEEKNAVVLNCEATNKFMKDLRNYSAPFMIYGMVVLFVLLSHEYSVLPLLINLGYGVVSFYIVMISYLYLKLFKQKSALHQEFSTPYYQKKLNLDETTLILINEELSSKLMDQFIFESVGKDSGFNFIDKLEKENAEKFLSERVQNRRIEESNIFEQDIVMESEPLDYSKTQKEENSNVKDKYVDKYSSFLED